LHCIIRVLRRDIQPAKTLLIAVGHSASQQQFQKDYVDWFWFMKRRSPQINKYPSIRGLVSILSYAPRWSSSSLCVNKSCHLLRILDFLQSWSCSTHNMLYFAISNVLTILLLGANSVLGAETRLHSQYAVKDRHYVPKQWSRIGPAPADHLIRLQIGLKQSQFSELERHLYEGIVHCWGNLQCRDADVRLSVRSNTQSLWTASFPSWDKWPCQALWRDFDASPWLASRERHWGRSAWLQPREGLDQSHSATDICRTPARYELFCI